jgi:hypothetical protein
MPANQWPRLSNKEVGNFLATGRSVRNRLFWLQKFQCKTLKIILRNLTLANTPRVDFTKLFCQAKSCQPTAFDKKISVQFHQQFKLQISSLNWLTFCQICLLFAKHCVPKKPVILFSRKSISHMLMKSNLRLQSVSRI